MEVNSVILEVKAINSGVPSPDEVGKANTAPKGVGVYLPQKFFIPVGPITELVSAFVTTPSGQREEARIDGNRAGHVTFSYQPKETGLHILHVYYNDEKIKGSPFQFHANLHNSKYVHAFGPGLSHGIVNKPAEFTIVTKSAGAGGVCLAVEGPSKAQIKCVDNEDGSCTVAYLPTKHGEYNIIIKMQDKIIAGSPFTAKISDGKPILDIPGMPAGGFSTKMPFAALEDIEISDLDATVKCPSGRIQPCTLKEQPNGHLGFSFAPQEEGEHEVSVLKNGQHIPSSPFKITIQSSELAKGHAGKVKVSGDGIKEGVTNVPNEFILDTREAGFGELDMSIEGPRRSKVDMELYDNDDGTCRVIYKPTQPGTFFITIKFGDDHIPGSPFEINVEEPADGGPERSFRSASKQGCDLWY